MPFGHRLRVSRGHALATIAAFTALAFAPAAADARPKRTAVSWGSVSFAKDAYAGEAAEKYLRSVLKNESRRADWGKGRAAIDASLDVRAFRVALANGVVRVTCSAVGRIAGGPAAKSTFSFGGLPEKQGELERHVLEMVARGIVVRLAEMARTAPTRVIVRSEPGEF